MSPPGQLSGGVDSETPTAGRSDPAASTDDLIDEVMPEDGSPFRLSQRERRQLVRAAALADQAVEALEMFLEAEDLEDALEAETDLHR